jgi:ribonucleoside-diphosphate reductase alpha chain
VPDAIGKVLQDHYINGNGSPSSYHRANGNGNGNDNGNGNGNGHHVEELSLVTAEDIETYTEPLQIGELCPDCQNASLMNEEGCRKCHSCGYSEC